MANEDCKMETPDSATDPEESVPNPTPPNFQIRRQIVAIVEGVVSSSSAICVSNSRNHAISTETASSQKSEDHVSSATDNLGQSILTIRCNDVIAEFYKNRFGSGGRGCCIKYKKKWYTPNKFEAECGRASSKDWKRSIRCSNRTLGALIHEGILVPHATSCICRVCCDDESAYGPIRLHIPCKRKSKTDEPNSSKVPKVEQTEKEEDTDSSSTQLDSNAEDSCSSKSADEELIGSPKNNVTNESIAQELLRVQKRIEDVENSLEKYLLKFKVFSKDSSVMLTSMAKMLQEKKTPVDMPDVVPNVLRKCENCNYDAKSLCGRCRRTSYCSKHCQTHDWRVHQLVCKEVKLPSDGDELIKDIKEEKTAD